MKKLFSILLALALCLSMFGCSLEAADGTQGAPDASATAAPATDGTSTDGGAADVDADTVIATVGDETVTFGDYKQTFEMYQEMFLSYYGFDIASDAETLAQYQDDILDMLVEQKLIQAKAKELGVTSYTAEQQTELDARVADELTALDEYYRATAEAEAADDATIDVEARIKELIEQEATQYAGYAMTYDEYIEYTKNVVAETYNQELLKAEMLKDVAVDDAELETLLASYVETDTATYTEDPAAYKDAQEYFEMNGGAPAYYVPENYHRIKHILVAPEGALPEGYDAKNQEVEGYEDELCELLLEDAVSGNGANEARIAELLETYKTAMNERDAMFDTYMGDAKTKAEEAYSKLEAGEDFVSVMNAYGMDENFINYPDFCETGMLINATATSETDWSDTVKAYFAELTLGQYSQVFMDDDGYHIILYFADEPAGARTLDSMRETLSSEALLTKQDAEWTAIVDGWMNDGSVTVNTELYKTVGA